MVMELALTFEQLGMKDVYSNDHLYLALRQVKGNKDLAVEIILSDQVKAPAASINHQVDFN